MIKNTRLIAEASQTTANIQWRSENSAGVGEYRIAKNLEELNGAQWISEGVVDGHEPDSDLGNLFASKLHLTSLTPGTKYIIQVRKWVMDPNSSGRINGQASLLEFITLKDGFIPPDIDSSSHILGNPYAPVSLVVYGGFQDPFTVRIFTTFQSLLERFGENLNVEFRHAPLTAIHPNGHISAQATECANDQGRFWDLFDRLVVVGNDLSKQGLLDHAEELGLDREQFIDCLTNGKYELAIDEAIRSAANRGITGTPTTFINDRDDLRITGAFPFETFVVAIEKELSIDRLLDDGRDINDIVDIDPDDGGGKLVTTLDSPAVYLIQNGQRRLFPNLLVYRSWFGNDTSQIEIISSEELNQYARGANMRFQPGSLVKITTDPKVYLVTSDGVLQWIVSEQVFHSLNLDFGNVRDVSDTLFLDYQFDNPID